MYKSNTITINNTLLLILLLLLSNKISPSYSNTNEIAYEERSRGTKPPGYPIFFISLLL